jgi:hypothetical protein
MDLMTASVVQQLLELVNNEMQSITTLSDSSELKAFWSNTCKHIEYQKNQEESKARYAALQV